MKARKLLDRKLPVIYRWVRRRRYFTHAVILSCALLFLPIGFVSGTKISRIITTNKALAATRAMAPEHSVADVIPDRERSDYGEALHSLVSEDPAKIHQLIGADFVVMFDEPDLKKREGAARVWQYRTANCVLDIYLDRDAASVLHYEVRQRKVAAFGVEGQHESAVDAVGCFKAIYQQRPI